MTATATAPPVILVAEGEPECGRKHASEHVSCARPPKHKGGHLSRDRRWYWQAEELPHCGARWPNRGPAGREWTCTLDRGHDGDHEAHGPRGKLLSLASDDEVTWDDEEPKP